MLKHSFIWAISTALLVSPVSGSWTPVTKSPQNARIYQTEALSGALASAQLLHYYRSKPLPSIGALWKSTHAITPLIQKGSPRQFFRAMLGSVLIGTLTLVLPACVPQHKAAPQSKLVSKLTKLERLTWVGAEMTGTDSNNRQTAMSSMDLESRQVIVGESVYLEVRSPRRPTKNTPKVKILVGFAPKGASSNDPKYFITTPIELSGGKQDLYFALELADKNNYDILYNGKSLGRIPWSGEPLRQVMVQYGEVDEAGVIDLNPSNDMGVEILNITLPVEGSTVISESTHQQSLKGTLKMTISSKPAPRKIYMTITTKRRHTQKKSGGTLTFERLDTPPKSSGKAYLHVIPSLVPFMLMGVWGGISSTSARAASAIAQSQSDSALLSMQHPAHPGVWLYALTAIGIGLSVGAAFKKWTKLRPPAFLENFSRAA